MKEFKDTDAFKFICMISSMPITYEQTFTIDSRKITINRVEYYFDKDSGDMINIVNLLTK